MLRVGIVTTFSASKPPFVLYMVPCYLWDFYGKQMHTISLQFSEREKERRKEGRKDSPTDDDDDERVFNRQRRCCWCGRDGAGRRAGSENRIQECPAWDPDDIRTANAPASERSIRAAWPTVPATVSRPPRTCYRSLPHRHPLPALPVARRRIPWPGPAARHHSTVSLNAHQWTKSV